MALTFAQMVQPQMAETIAQDIMNTMNGGGAVPVGGASPHMFQSNSIGGGSKEPAHMQKARSRSVEASQPHGGAVTARKENKK